MRLVNSTKKYAKFSVEFGRVSNLWLLLTQGVNGVCPVEMIELSGLVELSVVELTGGICT